MRGLPRQVNEALEKARDSALLAVEVYNKPAVKFKSGGYISLMVIAWTSLFHAIFFKRKRKPFYKKDNGRYVKVDGDFKYWELDECLRQYFATDTGNPVRKNLEFFIPLRNRIEHRSMPELDSSIFGECQAMLLNFDALTEKEFGAKYRLRESLSFALQLFPSSDNLAEAVKRNRDIRNTAEFIRQYRSSISPEIAASGRFSFKAFLIQVANHQSQEALPIQFVHYDKLSKDEQDQVTKMVALVKTKEVPVANKNLLKPGQVVERVQAGLGNPKVLRNKKQVERFNLDVHLRCWRRYAIRPNTGAANPAATNPKYCIYDERHKDYGYTQAWVDFLIEELKKPETWTELYPADSDSKTGNADE